MSYLQEVRIYIIWVNQAVHFEQDNKMDQWLTVCNQLAASVDDQLKCRTLF